MASIFDLFRRKPAAAPEVKESRTASLVMPNTGAKWGDRNYKAFAREGYGQNPVVFACINKISEAAASVPLKAWRGETELTEAEALTTLAAPAPGQTYETFLQAFIGHLYLSGDAFIEGVAVDGAPRELYPLRPDRMTVKPGDRGFPAAYVYEHGGRKVPFMVDQSTGASDIGHFKFFNPLDDWRGLSPIEAAAFEIDTHNEASAWIKGLLDNAATPSGALVAGAETPITDEQFGRLKETIEEQYAGASNAGRPMLLEGGLDWKAMSFAPNQVGVIEMKNAAARNICLTLGVPPQLLAIPGDNTYSNYVEARLAFWEDTVAPLTGFIASGMTNYFAQWVDGVELRPDYSGTPMAADKMAQRWASADTSTELTVNEKREMKGFEPLPGKDGDVVLINSGQIPLSAAGLGLGLDGDGGDPKGGAE